MYPIAMGLITAWPYAVACVASITDITAVLNTVTGLPLLEIYYQGTGSRVGATVLMALFAFCFFGCAVANGTTSSRTLWAVSRDGALLFSNLWAQVNPRFEMLVNAACLSATVISVYGLIFLGSTTAFIARVNAAVVFLQSSCAIPQAILLYRGRDKVLPERFFSPGKYGAAINATAVLWVFLLDVLYCMPSLMPVNPNNMNYVSVVSVGLVGFVISLWFVSKQKTFKGPQVDFAEIKRRREQALYGTAIEGEAGIGKVEA